MPTYIEDVRKARDELVEMGILIALEEIDPKTGEIRIRYFHRDFAPDSN